MTDSPKYVFSSIKGSKHKENWDNLLIIDNRQYYILGVFDGVSNAINGKQASLMSTNFVKANYKKYFRNEFDLKCLMFDLNQSLVTSDLIELYSTYCIIVYHKFSNIYQYSWLGDSRLYLITNKYLVPITDDDSFSKNILTKYLGNKNLGFDDFRQIQNERTNEHLLLCTDGFHQVMELKKLKFFDSFISTPISLLKYKIDSLIQGNNLDDSTYIFLK